MDIELWKKQKKELKLTFDDLAELSGVSRRQLFYLFNGNAKNTGIETVQRIERALGLDKEKSPPPELAEGEKAWLKLYYELNEDDQATLIKVVQAFKDMSDEQRAFMMQAIRLATKQ